jgi:hypothetical protein
MAVVALINPKVTAAGTDISAYVTACAFDAEADQLETTNFGSTGGWRTYITGLKKGEVKVTLNDDFAVGLIDSLLWTWFTGGTSITFNVKASNAANSTSNPEYQMNVLVTKMTPLAGKVGELANQDVTWPVTGAVTRAVA